MPEIIKLMQAQDQKGLSLLYDNYAASILGLIVGIVKNKEVGEEVLQQTFLKAWNNCMDYDGDRGSLFTWLAAISRNTAIDHIRLKSFQHQKNVDSIDTELADRHMSYTQTDTIDAQNLLQKLENKNKDVLDLVYLRGYTQREAAEALDISLGTLKSRLRKALNTLRKELIPEQKLFLGALLVITLLTILTWI